MNSPSLLPIFRLLARLPLGAARTLGEAAGWLLYQIPNRNRKDARINVALCFPEMSAQQQRHLVRRSLAETAKTFIEMPRIWLSPPEQLLRELDAGNALEVMREKLALGRGLIIAAPHLGNWEIGIHLLPQVAPVTALYRPPRRAELEQLITKGRSASGSTLVPTNQRGVKSLFKALKNGEIAVILPDQEPKGGGREAGVFAPFFGTPAATMVLINRLALKTGAQVLFMYVERRSDSPPFRFHTLEAPAELHHPDPVISATALNLGVENCVRQNPTQYQWSYRRFRERNDGGTSRYA